MTVRIAISIPDALADRHISFQTASSESSSSPLPPSPSPQKARPSKAKPKASTTPTKKKASGSVKEEVIGSPSKSPVATKAKPVKAGSGTSSGGGTNITMATAVLKHAITLLTAEELRIVAEKVNADPVKLRDVSLCYRIFDTSLSDQILPIVELA
jgi:hypothetical protein